RVIDHSGSGGSGALLARAHVFALSSSASRYGGGKHSARVDRLLFHVRCSRRGRPEPRRTSSHRNVHTRSRRLASSGTARVPGSATFTLSTISPEACGFFP